MIRVDGFAPSSRLSSVERTQPGGPHAAARTAVIWEVLRREVARGAGLRVVDVGGGTGGFAVPLARAGHEVTVVDPSPDALAALVRRAEEAGVAERIRAVQGDADDLAELLPSGRIPSDVDLILCHSVLEVVDSPTAVASALAALLRTGAAASVLVASRAGAALTRAMAGQLDLALAVLTDPDGRWGSRDTVRRRFDIDGATRLLAQAGLTVEEIHGVRVVADIIPATVAERDHELLAAFEGTVAGQSPFRDVAAQLHLLARKP
jgi:S-adenosylmethionine-dependent methyltransferase